MKTFKELNLSPEIMQGLDDLGFVEPSPVQAKVIPRILESKNDLIALAQTGTGKTAAFSLPILNQIEAGNKDLQAIIICPTRELCLQISQDIKNFTKYTKDVKVTPVYGGERMDIQINALKRGTNIVVGTPGRTHDLIRRKVLKLQDVQWLVLDEADEMLDMGFKEDLDAILSETPENRQTLLFSATMSRSVHSIAKRYMKEAEEISLGTKNIGAENVSHEYYIVHSRDRFEGLKRVLDSLPGVYGILFCRTRSETQELAEKLKRAGYYTEALHGDVSQTMRTKIMDRFKRKQVKLLVATDVAARGIDVSDLSHVINYNLPDKNEGYTHRSGRTGRAQKSGVSVSLVGPRDTRKIRELESIIGKSFELKKIPSGEEVCQKQIDSFIDEIEKADTKDIGSEKYFNEIVGRLDKIHKEDLIKYFVADKFSQFMDHYKNARDLNMEAKTFESSRGKSSISNEVSLKINFGKKDGFDIKKLFSLVNSSRTLKGIEIGQIDLMPNFSTFSVEKDKADSVIGQLSGQKFKDGIIEVSMDSGGRPTSRRSSSGRSNSRSGGSSNRRGKSERKRSSSRDFRGKRRGPRK